MSERPMHLPQGTPLGEHFTIEGLVRLTEGRMFYLANDIRPDRTLRKCWACLNDESPRSARACVRCKAPLTDRRFLVSARWKVEGFQPYLDFVARNERHAGLASPVAAFVEADVLYSVIPYLGDGLMVDEASPLPNRRVFGLGQRALGALARLHTREIAVASLQRANLLVAQDGTMRLFDLDIASVGRPVEREQRVTTLASLAEILRRYCDPEAIGLQRLFLDAERGSWDDTMGFGRAMERVHNAWVDRAYLPRLAVLSDVGLLRQLNEDNWSWLHVEPQLQFYVVADGMGGHDCGEIASALAVETIVERLRPVRASDPVGLETRLREAFQAANNAVKDHADAKGTDMGTTMVCLLVAEGRVGYLANVGDSRGYLLRDGVLDQLTKDHSWVQKMVDKGKLKAEEARHHPHSNILLRTVGTDHDVEPEMFRVELLPGDRLMICSDGLWNEVDDRDMESILNTYSDPRIAARELVRAAHHGGGKDNVTLLVVEV